MTMQNSQMSESFENERYRLTTEYHYLSAHHDLEHMLADCVDSDDDSGDDSDDDFSLEDDVDYSIQNIHSVNELIPSLLESTGQNIEPETTTNKDVMSYLLLTVNEAVKEEHMHQPRTNLVSPYSIDYTKEYLDSKTYNYTNSQKSRKDEVLHNLETESSTNCSIYV